jgi:hypothetical protein
VFPVNMDGGGKLNSIAVVYATASLRLRGRGR